MKEAYDKIKAFHEKNEFPSDELFDNRNFQRIGTNLVASIGHTLQAEAMRTEQQALEMQEQGDDRLYRTHLMIEELGECLVAMSKGNYVEFLDGLADVLYVVIGTAVAYGIPIWAVFDEVHLSNMSKPLRSKKDPRMRQRVGEYFKPRIEDILRKAGKITCDGCEVWVWFEDLIPYMGDDEIGRLLCEHCLKEKEDGTK